MSEALPPPPQQQDADIAIMAADLTKRRRRLQLLNLAILLVPLAAGVIFLADGRNHNEKVIKSVTKKASSRVAATVKETVPLAVDAEVKETVPLAVDAEVKEAVPLAVKTSLETTVLPEVRKTVADTVPAAVEKSLAEPAVKRRLETLVAASAVSRWEFEQLRKDLTTLKTQLDAADLEGPDEQIEDPERFRVLLALIERLQASSSDLDERLRKLPPPIRERLGDIGKIQEDLRQLRGQLEKLDGE